MPASSHSFNIYYRGGMADRGLLEAEAFGDSLASAARLYKMMAHYSELGLLPRRHKVFEVYTRAAVKGRSVDVELVVQAVQYSDLIAGGVVGVVIKALLEYVLGRSQKERLIETIERNRHDEMMRQYDTVNRLIDVISRDRLPTGEHPDVQGLIKPLEEGSCDSIVQFPNDEDAVILTRKEAGDNRLKARRVRAREIRIARIRRLNIETANCSVEIEDEALIGLSGRVVFGEIRDPALLKSNNDYTRVMHSQQPAWIFAEADVVAGFIRRLYITGIRTDNGQEGRPL